MRPVLAITAFAVLAACVSPREAEVRADAESADGYPALVAPTPVFVEEKDWWLRAPSDAISASISAAMEDAPSVQIAAAARDAAAAATARAEAARWFNINLNGRATAQDDGDTVDETLRGSLDASGPLDFSGRLKAERDAARYDLARASASLANARLAFARDFALEAVNAGETAELTALITDQIGVSETLLRLTELRFAQGQASIVDVLQQRNQLASLRQQTPDIETRRRRALDALSTLAGDTPNADGDDLYLTTPVIGDAFAIGAPEDLLDRRPDLRDRAAAVSAADERLEAALRDRLPSFSFSASSVALALSGAPQDFITGTVSGALTVFDTGAKRAAVRSRRALAEQAAAQYLGDWLDAVAEVNGLIAEETNAKRELAIAEDRLQTTEALLEAARRRYRQGASDYLPVLNALQSAQQQQRTTLTLKADLARTRIRLHAALGLAPGQDDVAPRTRRFVGSDDGARENASL